MPLLSVSALVRITNADSSEPEPFSVVLKDQIMTLRKELGNQTPVAEHAPPLPATVSLDESVTGPRLPSEVPAVYSFPSGSRLRPFLGGTSTFRQSQVLHAPHSAYPQMIARFFTGHELGHVESFYQCLARTSDNHQYQRHECQPEEPSLPRHSPADQAWHD